MECPDSLKHVWSWFNQLEMSRTFGGMSGINPISFCEMESFFNLIGIEPYEWEIYAIKNLDMISLKAHNEYLSRAQKNKPKK